MSSGALVESTGIHGSIPVEHNPQGGESWVYDERRERIFTYLHGRKGEVRTAFKIADACGLSVAGTQVLVRKLIKELNHYFAEKSLAMAIVSTPSGFYFTDNPKDVLASIQRHQVRITGLLRTIKDETALLYRMGGSLGMNNEEGEC